MVDVFFTVLATLGTIILLAFMLGVGFVIWIGVVFTRPLVQEVRKNVKRMEDIDRG